MAMTDTMNATAMPKSRMMISCAPMPKPVSIKNFKSFKPLAPSIAGIARKKVYSAATLLEVPIRMAPTIVAPEREVPGMSASIWNTPMSSAVL